MPMHFSPSLTAALAHLDAVAAEQQSTFGNPAFAKGILYALQYIRGDLSGTAEILLSQEEAVAYTGYSDRQLRRTMINRGSPRRPHYRLGDLQIKPGHTPKLPSAFHAGTSGRRDFPAATGAMSGPQEASTEEQVPHTFEPVVSHLPHSTRTKPWLSRGKKSPEERASERANRPRAAKSAV